MAEAKQILYPFQELAALMVKDQNIHEGHWGIYVRFGIAATNLGSSESDLKPTAIVPIIELGLQKFDEPTSLTVDAAEVNPSSKTASKAASSKAAKVKP